MDGRAPNQPPPGKRHASLSFNRLQKNIGMGTSSTPTRQMVQDASLASHFVGPRWWWWQALAAILAPWIPALVPGVRPRCSSPAAVAEALAAPRASASPSAASPCRTADARVTNARLQHRSLPDAVLQRAGSVVGSKLLGTSRSTRIAARRREPGRVLTVLHTRPEVHVGLRGAACHDGRDSTWRADWACGCWFVDSHPSQTGQTTAKAERATAPK